MNLDGWDERYRSGERVAEDLDIAPTPLVVETARKLTPGKALDLACGAGRNALWLAEQGWDVTAIDGAQAAIEILKTHAAERAVRLDTRVADLECGEFEIASCRWNLILMCYYLQRNLFEPVRQGVSPGGVVISIVHITEAGEEPTAHRLRPGELELYFSRWEILHRYEGKPNDSAHRRAVAEIVARRPPGA